MTSYWSRILDSRISRRRAIVAGAGASAAAALLAACGGSESKGSAGPAEKQAASLLATPKETSNEAKPGGVWINRLLSVADNLEPVAANGSVGFTHSMPVYSKFAKYGKGLDGKLPTSEMITGDAMSGWET